MFCTFIVENEQGENVYCKFKRFGWSWSFWADMVSLRKRARYKVIGICSNIKAEMFGILIVYN